VSLPELVTKILKLLGQATDALNKAKDDVNHYRFYCAKIEIEAAESLCRLALDTIEEVRRGEWNT